MRILAIDSATEACSVALFENGRLLAGEFRQLGRGHAEALVPMIASMPEKGQAGRIVVSLGPGSFTGLRVGLAAARALALAWKADLAGYSTTALVAMMARAQRDGVSLAVAMSGGHGEWFIERFDPHGASLGEAVSMRPEAAGAIPDALVAGSQAEALVAARGSGTALNILPDARMVNLLSPNHFVTAHLSYGREPDARLPGEVSR